MFQKHYIGNKKSTFLACNSEQLYAVILETSKKTIFYQTAKSTLIGSLKFPKISFTWFPKGSKCNAYE